MRKESVEDLGWCKVKGSLGGNYGGREGLRGDET